MEVNDELVHKLAKLSRLSFDETEFPKIKADLENMIRFVDKLKEVDVSGIEPLTHMTGNVNVLRNDIVEGECTTREALSNAANHDDHFFKVPKVIIK